MITCFGGTNIDIKIQAFEKYILGSSNPVRSYLSAGGVARNISECLLRLGTQVQLVSRVGKDFNGEWLLKNLQRQGIDCRHITQSQNFPTAQYTALLESNGEMLLATSEMDIYDELTPDLLACYLNSRLKDSTLWVVDSNLSAKTLEYLGLSKPQNSKLWAIGVSVSKAKRLISVLPYTSGVILNQDEFCVLIDQSSPLKLSFKTVQEGCEGLFNQGVEAVIVTCGSTGVYLGTQNKIQFFEVQQLLKVQDVTGAGDAFAAGFLYGLLNNKSLNNAVQFGLAAARITLKTTETVHPLLSFDLLTDQLKSDFYKVVQSS